MQHKIYNVMKTPPDKNHSVEINSVKSTLLEAMQ